MDIQSQAKSILRKWALEFHECGDFDDGISILQDVYAMDDNDKEDLQRPSYAIFVHRDSLSGSFPPHDHYGNLVMHRSSEEVCFCVWLDLSSAQDQEINTPDTELDIDNFYRLIISIEEKYQ